jgi:16S rRNA A1518/A1519 N6-dimethyltransferase RsmA/KsgA/DIM1 with predicted DNA glycosylase/AP lyase activity
VTAIEIDPALIDQLRTRLVDTNVEIILGDARATGLPSGSFTGAASFHAESFGATVEGAVVLG